MLKTDLTYAAGIRLTVPIAYSPVPKIEREVIMGQQDNKPDNTVLRSLGKDRSSKTKPSEAEEFIDDASNSDRLPGPSANPNRTKTESPTKKSQL